MRVLVAYASRHGATAGIAERIAAALRAAGLEAEAHPAGSLKKIAGFDAYVIGSAAYIFHWLKEARNLVNRNRAVLASKPVWLFSSGPLGTEPLDAEGHDQKEVTIPREMPELRAAVNARDHRVFFGAYERGRKPVGLMERFMALMPATKDAFPQGDFRDWAEIDAWAAEIAAELRPPSAT